MKLCAREIHVAAAAHVAPGYAATRVAVGPEVRARVALDVRENRVCRDDVKGLKIEPHSKERDRFGRRRRADARWRVQDEPGDVGSW